VATKVKCSIHIAVWIDGKTAMVSTTTRPFGENPGSLAIAGQQVEHLIESGVERTMKSTGGRHGRVSYQHQTVDPAVKNERRRAKEITQYLDRVMARFNPEPEGKIITRIVLAGPGETKKKLAGAIALNHPEWPTPEIKTTTGRLTTAQKRVALFGSQRISSAIRKKVTTAIAPRRMRG
jgi:hypothetical protein